MFNVIQIISFLLLTGPIDDNGWASVDRPKKNPLEQNAEEDPSIWPVFSRQFGVDRILIRFPGEPIYVYPNLEQGDSDTMEIESASGDAVHRLRVEKSTLNLDDIIKSKIRSINASENSMMIMTDRFSERIVDLLYRDKGKWIRERFISTSSHLYVLQTLSDTLSEASHLQFLSSFDLEIRDENKVFHREISSEN